MLGWSFSDQTAQINEPHELDIVHDLHCNLIQWANLIFPCTIPTKSPGCSHWIFHPNILELPPAQCTFIYWFTLTCQWKYDCIAPQCKCLWSHCYEIVCHRNESCRIEQENEVWNSVLMTHSPTPFFFFFFCQIFLWAWFWFVRKHSWASCQETIKSTRSLRL